jgi:hypothetical protein
VTLIALVLNRPNTELVLGSVDLVVAVAALGVALPGERSATRRPRVPKIRPGRP